MMDEDTIAFATEVCKEHIDDGLRVMQKVVEEDLDDGGEFDHLFNNVESLIYGMIDGLENIIKKEIGENDG